MISRVSAKRFMKRLISIGTVFKDLLRKCPHHGFSELHQIDTFYNALTQSDQDSLNAIAGGNLLNRTPRDALMIIENKSKVRTSRNKPVVSKMSANTSSTTACPSEIADLTDSVNAMIHHVKTSPPETVELRKEIDTTLSKQTNELKNMMSSFMQMNNPSGSGLLPSNTVANPRGDVKSITTRRGVSYDGPTIPPTPSSLPKEAKRETETTKDKELVECLALADLGASINLMPLFVWKKLSLPELTSTRMTLELTDRSVAYPKGVAEDVFVKVGKFRFLADFVVVDYDVDPRVPLILGRPFLRTTRALIDVYGEELTLRFNDEAITFNVGHTSSYSYKYDDASVNRIDVIDVTCEEYAQEVLGFLDSSTSSNPTPSSDPIISTSSPSLTHFEGGDFILEEIEACLTNDSIPPGINDADFDPEGDIRLLEESLNNDPSSSPSERTSF
ncbi:reverse transcriptase domain-containing protein [Tanacetum coccineum]|uniref:Reverse transcriptase domain-containing protein n=1 Tax=Tanacetum coccineum TaxID=301880 RepID=A0ABQ4X8W7_9ASTR